MNNFEKCRLLGHAWDEIVPADLPLYINRRVAVYWRCERCATVRRETYNRMGDIDTRKYIYPDGYLSDLDHRPTRQHLRLMALKERKQ